MGLSMRPTRSDSPLLDEVGSLLQGMFRTSMNAIVRFGNTAIDSWNDPRRYEISYIILDLLDTLR